MELGARLFAAAAIQNHPIVAQYSEYLIEFTPFRCAVLTGSIMRNSDGVIRISYQGPALGDATVFVIRDLRNGRVIALLPDGELAITDTADQNLFLSYAELPYIGPPKMKAGLQSRRVRAGGGESDIGDQVWVCEELGIVTFDVQRNPGGLRCFLLDCIETKEPQGDVFTIPSSYRVEAAED